MHSYSIELGGRTLTMEIGKIAKQANGAVLVRYGDTAVVVAATGTKTPREGVDFFPLTVDFEELLILKKKCTLWVKSPAALLNAKDARLKPLF